jgi:hypothetical protein
MTPSIYDGLTQNRKAEAKALVFSALFHGLKAAFASVRFRGSHFTSQEFTMFLSVRIRQFSRVSVSASLLALLTILSMGAPQVEAQSPAVPSRDQAQRTLLRQSLYFEPRRTAL